MVSFFAGGPSKYVYLGIMNIYPKDVELKVNALE